ncbi:MAG: PolC-type DNA polymerase III [Eubacteriales bacterium]|nr:PolC-type DNA polymerase III [Eubacteriales bacterium]
MQEELNATLARVGISDESVHLESVTLNREQNVLTVFFRCDREPPMDQTEKLTDALEQRLGTRVRVKWIDTSEIDAEEVFFTSNDPQSVPSASVSKPNPAIAGKRSIFGGYVASGIKTPIKTLKSGKDKLVIEGTVVSINERNAFKNKRRKGETSFPLDVSLTDGTDTIYCSLLLDTQEQKNSIMAEFDGAQKRGDHILAQGVCRESVITGELMFYANSICVVPFEQRKDPCESKRVELHLHTRMSTQDGITDVNLAFETAKRFGHPALAITDHGVVQAFPAAAKAAKKNGVKPIFGVEGYLLRESELMDMDQTFVVFDLETTGLKPEQCEIIEIGAVKLENGVVIDRFQTFINSGGVVPAYITELTGISTDMLAGAPNPREVLTQFHAFAEGCCLVAHNAEFDMGFLRYHGKRFSIEFSNPYADTLMLARDLMHDLVNHKLDTVCEALQVELLEHHRATDDAQATGEVFCKLLDQLRALGLNRLPVRSEETKQERGKKRSPTNHIIILAETQAGMKNLYRLVSYAHLDHFHYNPIIPFSLLSIYREGLILGSACEAGELYQSILNEAGEERIEYLANTYDFLEIQPRCNNAFLVREGKATEDRILEINRAIVSLGDRLGIPVAATGDVHFLDPEDAIFREVILTKNGFEDASFQAPLYYKTTAEMLEEFAYLGEETARRVVVDVPNEIANRCELLKPFPDGTHAPTIENASDILRDMAIQRAHTIYGEPLPEVVQARLDKELKSIIGNGFASLYLMAQRLVHKSNSDGYLVGSRGSVGSSFVATMSGITEVNPLQPHYVCPNCKHSDFDVDRLHYACGIDMPNQDCPVCGAKYQKMGFDIPFEVFLGFDGDKTPDIDLNFSGEYQPVAHKYVEEMFGRGHAFRAGTISGVAERTAYEYVRIYEEKTGRTLRKAERERIAKGCQDVKVTTGQHPGGIVIVPKEDDILDYTPIQYPADKADKNTITTHFDFHAMDDRLVKLDILGHDDPTALRMLQDLTGLDPVTIPLDDPDTMRIYLSSDSLKVDLSAIGCKVGTLGTPEFGTGFVRGVLDATQPTTMEELVRISGLTHGTDVWLGNAEPLVINNVASLNEVICTRDDIMNYLIQHGVDASSSFKIMESVRKGKGLKPEMEQKLIDNAIPAWYIDSCKKIKYMFPRGHAVAYTMMSFRVAYYKVHYPLQFYSVYYTVRADLFDVSLAAGGAERVLETIRELERSAAKMSDSEKGRTKDIITILEVVYEMNLRGIVLLPVDLYRSDATKFLIEDGAIRPPFNAIPGVGSTAAIALAENRKDRVFHTVEEFRSVTKANSAVLAAMEKCGCFDGMEKTAQISLF